MYHQLSNSGESIGNPLIYKAQAVPFRNHRN
jgi:hypothetical protein